MPRIVRLARALLLPLAIVLAFAACSGKNRTDAADVLPVEELYQEAHHAIEAGNWERAATYHKRLIARFPFGKYNEQAQLELAYAYYKQHKPEDATSAVDRFIKLYPTHEKIPYAYYLRGLTNFSREGGWLSRLINRDETRHDLTFAHQAFQDFGELVKRFPESIYAEDARQRMIFLRNGLSQAELNVASYYFRREAYIAVTARTRFILDNYEQTPQTADALALMCESYHRLGQETLAQDTRKVLALNYPEHPYLAGAWPAQQSRWKTLIPFFGTRG
jgi:outer membrane protein assembly factor BamD